MAAELIHDSPAGAGAATASFRARRFFAQVSNLLKLRIGVVMMLTALVAMLITPGPAPTAFEVAVLCLGIILAAGAAGAFNQYYEVDLDRRMPRTCTRPFVTGYFEKGPLWLGIILLLLIAGLLPAALVLNIPTAVHIFLGAFFYAIVYTVWLKRRSWTNIVIGGASGSFAVLAGAAAIDPNLGPVPILLALVLFFWTPSHFWSLAIAKHKDYLGASVPMLPVIIGKQRCAMVVLVNTDYPGRAGDRALLFRHGLDIPAGCSRRWRLFHLP